MDSWDSIFRPGQRPSLPRPWQSRRRPQPAATFRDLWQNNLHPLATRTRPDLLSDLPAFCPTLVALGGQEAVVETYAAIEDVGRWWP